TSDNTHSAQDAGSLTCTPAPAQLAVTKSPKNGTFSQNGQASFTIVVSNPGSGLAATNVKLDDQLPHAGGLVWQSATASPTGSCSITGGYVLHCDLGDIAAGPTSSVTVQVSSTATTPLAAC